MHGFRNTNSYVTEALVVNVHGLFVSWAIFGCVGSRDRAESFRVGGLKKTAWRKIFLLNYFLFNFFLFLQKSGGGGPPSARSLGSTEIWDVIAWFTFHLAVIGLENPRHPLGQSAAEQICTLTYTCSRSLLLFPLSSFGLLKIFCLFWLAYLIT